MTKSVDNIIGELKNHSNIKRAIFSERYFPKEEGNSQDIFFGCTVPEIRKIAFQNKKLIFLEIKELLESNIHEVRLCGLWILVYQLEIYFKKLNKIVFQKNNSKNLFVPNLFEFKNQFEINEIINTIKQYKEFYIQNIKNVNHWDLVDTSSHKILGRSIVMEVILKLGKNKFSNISNFLNSEYKFLELINLSKSKIIWENRIAIISQFAFIANDNLLIPLSICKYHLENKHHYIQKAVGWILREVGKINKPILNEFIISNYPNIGSICKSYALEKHSLKEKEELKKISIT